MRRTTPAPGRAGEVIYQVYVRSFQDGGGDGIGDLPGITRRLDHVARLGADIVWLTPFFRSPMKDFGYDVADYLAVDPLFGADADFDRLLQSAHALRLKVMIDLVLSHTSDQHVWFVESASARANPKADWYVWADPKPDGTPPNNWLAVFGGSAWQWHPGRRQYYLHNFLASQPDLNFWNPDVVEAVLETTRTWFRRGVDGARLDVVNYYFHDARLRSNPPAPTEREGRVTQRHNPYGWQDHVYDHTRPRMLPFLERLRAVADETGAVLMGELVTDRYPGKVARAYTAGAKRLHSVYSFDLFMPSITGADLRRVVEEKTREIGPSGWWSWAFSNHDVPRAVSRFRLPQAAQPALVAALGVLRGDICLYQGEELGLPEADVPFEALQDPYGIAFWPSYKGRDGCRTPIPWENSATAGFTTGNAKPWLPIDPRHPPLSVAAQEADPASVLARVRRFLHWRRGVPALRTGTIAFHDAPEALFVVERRLGPSRVIAAINLSAERVRARLPVFAGARTLDGHGFDGRLDGDMLDIPPFSAIFAS